MLLVKAGVTVSDEEKYHELRDFGFVEGDAPVPEAKVTRDPRTLLP